MRKAIVMAGGQGSRLHPLTLARPKPLISVANRPACCWAAPRSMTPSPLHFVRGR